MVRQPAPGPRRASAARRRSCRGAGGATRPPPAGRAAGPGRGLPRPRPVPAGAGRGEAEEPFGDAAHEIRIACIDVGGGTTDLMIARYNFESNIDDTVRGQVLHQDGIALGGDQLVKRLLEAIVVPAFAETIGLEEEDVLLLFGPEVPRNREIRAQRINWINRLFVPLAQAYLAHAADDAADEPISHTDPEIVDPVVVQSLQTGRATSSAGRATTTCSRSSTCVSTRPASRRVVHDVFDELLFDYCQRIVELRGRRGAAGRASLEALLRPATGGDVRAALAVADRAHAQPLCRQLVSLPGREGAQPGRDRRSQEPGGRGRGHRVHGPPRHAAAVQVRDAGEAAARTATTGA